MERDQMMTISPAFIDPGNQSNERLVGVEHAII